MLLTQRTSFFREIACFFFSWQKPLTQKARPVSILELHGQPTAKHADLI